MGTDHYSADDNPQNKDGDVSIARATPYTGRRKGRKHDKFTLPSGEVVQIYYVNPDSLPDGYYYAGVPKAFYAQVAGQEFRSDAPTKIQPAVIEYLTKTKPAVFEDVILIDGGESNETTSYILHVSYTKIKYGVRGDGIPLVIDRAGCQKQLQARTSMRIVPFTEKRWAWVVEMRRIATNFYTAVSRTILLPQAKVAEILDGAVFPREE